MVDFSNLIASGCMCPHSMCVCVCVFFLQEFLFKGFVNPLAILHSLELCL